MAKIIAQIPGKIWYSVRNHARELLEVHGFAEKCNCARNRHNLWLQAEPDYSTKRYKKAIDDNRLWTYIKRICPEADLAQVFGGNRGIDWHRDAAYAEANAYILSLGVSNFEIETPTGIKKFELKGGELLQFNCKNRHRATNVDADRIGIGIWSAKIPISF